MRNELCITHEGTQRRIYKGVQGVVFIDKWRSGLCFSSVGGVRRRLALSAIAPRLTPPTTRMLSSWLFRSMSRFHSSGGLTAADRAPLQFPPLTLPCIGAWVVGGATAQNFFHQEKRSGWWLWWNYRRYWERQGAKVRAEFSRIARSYSLSWLLCKVCGCKSMK
jgi:hypothetical protein